MRKAMFYGARDLRVEEVKEPEPGPQEARVKINYCGICGSDLHEYLHGLFPQSRFGHEACGQIVELGSAVVGFKVGDRVLALDKGGYAEYTLCPQQQMIKIPEGMSWERAATVEPLAAAAYAIERGAIRPEDIVLITGAGPIGLMLLIGLKAIGVGTVYVTDVSEKRRKKAEALGARGVFNPQEVKISSAIKELTAGQGVDVAIEAVGLEATLKDCLMSVRLGGKVIVEGIFTDRVPINMFGFVVRETTMIGSNSTNPTLAMEWIESKGAMPEAIITKIVPLDQIVTEGFEVLTSKTKEEIKILVKCS